MNTVIFLNPRSAQTGTHIVLHMTQNQADRIAAVLGDGVPGLDVTLAIELMPHHDEQHTVVADVKVKHGTSRWSPQLTWPSLQAQVFPLFPEAEPMPEREAVPVSVEIVREGSDA